MEEDQNIGNEMEQKNDMDQKNERGLRETFRSGSPDDVRDKVKEVVEKGVAAVAGALRGFSEKTRDEKISDQTRGALHEAGEAARKTVSGLTEEAQNLKEPLREAGQKLKETARDIRGSVGSEVRDTKSALESGGSYGSSMGMGGSSLGSSEESEFPDIRNTPLAESDKKLQGKDLTEDNE